jgi:WD40 repeat protein
VHQTADGFDVLVHGCNQIWNLGSPEPNFTLEAHQKGVNCVEYFSGGDRPYLITGSDDQTAKVTFSLILQFNVITLGAGLFMFQ